MRQPTKDPDLEPPAPRERLTRERIIETAMRIMDAEGLEAVTMRRVGRDLGVEAMSLYNHVEDKDDILGGVIETVMSEFAFPAHSDDWTESARQAARAWRDLLKAHPNVMILMSHERRPIKAAASLRPMDHALGILAQLGLGAEETVRAFRAFGGYIQGFVLAEVANLFGGDQPDQVHSAMPASVPVDELPNVVAHMPYLFHCDFDAEFEYGLDLMLLGLVAKRDG